VPVLSRTDEDRDNSSRALLVVLAIAYFATAKTSLLLAIPPGYATAVWPPSGIALAALLLQGIRLWPGIWLGAAVANFTVEQSVGPFVAHAPRGSARI
jgi:integral membrane sensor domain MASE1